jgi:hypothetical protein
MESKKKSEYAFKFIDYSNSKHEPNTNNILNVKSFVDISGLDAEVLLECLWRTAAKILGKTETKYNRAEVRWDENGFVDEICDIKIQTLIFGKQKTIDCLAYDKMYGQGMLQKTVTYLRNDPKFVDPFLRANVKNNNFVCLKLRRKDNTLIEIPFSFHTALNLERVQTLHRRNEANEIELPPTVASFSQTPKVQNVFGQQFLDESYYHKDPLFVDSVLSPMIYGITTSELCNLLSLRSKDKQNQMSKKVGESKKLLKEQFPSVFNDQYFNNHPFPYTLVGRKNCLSVVSLPFLFLTPPFASFFNDIENAIFTAILDLIVDIKTHPNYKTATNDQTVENFDMICRQLLVNAKRIQEFIVLHQNDIGIPASISSDETFDYDQSSKQLSIKHAIGAINVKTDNCIDSAQRNYAKLLERFKQQEESNNAVYKVILEMKNRIKSLEEGLDESQTQNNSFDPDEYESSDSYEDSPFAVSENEDDIGNKQKKNKSSVSNAEKPEQTKKKQKK